MKVGLVNLGCSKNQIDGEYVLGSLVEAGFTHVTDLSEAELILVNTCAFIQEAKQEAIDTILEMATYKTDGTCRYLAVCGCFSERYRREVASRFPEVDYWFGVHTWREEMAVLLSGAAPPHAGRVLTLGGPSHYLRISQGCSRKCSFCVIPSIRGTFASTPYDTILAEARRLEEAGVQECILVSQDTSSYGRDVGSTLVRLVERLLSDTSFPWLRLMYLHPSRVDTDLIDLVASEPRVCSYFDIPLQHIADPVLRNMRRTPLSSGIRALIERIRERAPSAALRSSFIVGFPGETERDFGELLSFLEWARFEKAGVFPFSPEEGTPAADMRPRPRNSTARRRCEDLMTLQREISREIGLTRVGTVLDVLVEPPVEADEGDREGRTQWDAPEIDGRVHLCSNRPLTEHFVRAHITDTDEYDLYGTVLD